MKRDADSHADEDKQKKELADARNEADQAAWSVEKMLKENADKIADGDKAAVDAVKKAKEGKDVEAIKKAVNNLHTAAHAMSQHLGRGAGGPPLGGDQPAGGPAKDTPPRPSTRSSSRSTCASRREMWSYCPSPTAICPPSRRRGQWSVTNCRA